PSPGAPAGAQPLPAPAAPGAQPAVRQIAPGAQMGGPPSPARPPGAAPAPGKGSQRPGHEGHDHD
ncbi:MAG TPA: hypothetical protein VJN18_20790, partial [Polyangiaceae bacterium]|nr:hypothetical protein [Polyangiaceae bacterium]